MADGNNQQGVQLPPGYQDAAPVSISLPPGFADAKPAQGSANAGSAASVPAKDETGIWAGVKRNTVGLVAGLYHALSDPATDQEKTDLLTKIRNENQKYGDSIPESLATDPSRATLAWHRLMDAPASQLNSKGSDEVAAAKELLSRGDTWKGVNTYMSGRTDQGLAAIPLVGPWINGVANRAENGDVSGAATDIAAAVALENAPEAVKTAKKVLNTPLAESVRDAVAQQIAGPIVRKTPTATMNDLKFGRNPAEAITKEPGLEGVTVSGLRDGVAKRMGEVGQVMDSTLSDPAVRARGTIDTGPIIDQAASDAKATPLAKLNKGLSDRIDTLADALKTKFGNTVKDPLEATQFKRDVGEAAKWTGQPFDNEANQFLVDVYRQVKDGVNSLVPEVKPLNERYADLLSAKTALDRRIAFNTNRPWSIGRGLLGVGGGAAGTLIGGSTGGAEGAALGATVDALRSEPSRIIAGKVVGAKHPPLTPPANAPAVAAAPAVTSPITGAALASPSQLFRQANP